MHNLNKLDNLTHMAFAAELPEDLAEFVPDGRRFADIEQMERRVIAGNDHAQEIADNALEIAALDVDAPDYLARVVALSEERKRLQGLAVEPSQVALVATGRTVGEVWSELDDSARTRYLKASGIKVVAFPDGSARMDGDPTLGMPLNTIAA